MRSHKIGIRVVSILIAVLLSPVGYAIPISDIDHLVLTLYRLPPGSRDTNDPEREILGRGFLKLDLGSAFRTIDQFEEDWDFCGIHGGEPEHEDFCAALGHSIFVEAPVIFGRLEMFGHTFSTEDFQWGYQFTPTHELSLSLFVAIGNQRWCPTDENCPQPPPGDWFLTFSTDGESGSFNYLVNGFTPVGSPWCDNDVCERLAWTSVVPEPGSLALFTLGLVGLGFMRRRRQ